MEVTRNDIDAVHKRIDSIAGEVRDHGQKIEHIDRTMGQIADRQRETENRLSSIEDLAKQTLSECQNVRAQVSAWGTAWGSSLGQIHERVQQNSVVQAVLGLLLVLGFVVVFFMLKK